MTKSKLQRCRLTFCRSMASCTSPLKVWQVWLSHRHSPPSCWQQISLLQVSKVSPAEQYQKEHYPIQQKHIAAVLPDAGLLFFYLPQPHTRPAHSWNQPVWRWRWSWCCWTCWTWPFSILSHYGRLHNTLQVRLSCSPHHSWSCGCVILDKLSFYNFLHICCIHLASF